MVFRPEFLALIAGRRAALRQELAGLLPAGGSMVWEIGCGHGHFLARYAAENPGRLCCGVDISGPRLERARRKAARARLANCHFLQAEAREFLNSLPAGVTVAETWVLFPDPWPKKRHHKNRILQPAFFEALAGRAPPGARLYFRTDHAEYHDTVADLVRQLSTWRLEPDAPWPLEHETVFQALADRFYSLVAVRTSHPARPIETTAPGLPPPATPTSPA
ncbi:MAG TPA: methyltransferase domain-containing protein [Lacunisphaera sp.]|nr:methyltransferase domain-containing protein [Lacunisphaera sp.]